ncbi:DUF4305 domain-containing protein [Cytobacillus sp. FSL W7-1323]|uniref:DUF4305 domain-containing protein n=3 Tax=Cytobacillus TaxID=2675230 RepID=A0A248TGB7_9BACI|nr:MULTISPECIES: DUF4305 domain-containing protein [Cytobacillus]ASV67231.1 hypothetical protein CKF48_07745 [Cytobacillus kochii]MBD7939472.1 YdiK family protein [Cytobacillus stercorigallinarum]MCA1029257.1 YdiK family protein [Cytobacillus kochii]MCM3324831.1 YdiK family protein [Cytobacillus kochii]MCM3347224.1 YdiK family protein [Cytobacillus kochii]
MRTPLFTGIISLLFGFVFIYFAIINLQNGGGWGFLTIFILIFATFDIGGGIKLIAMHYRMKKKEDKK